MEKLYYTLIGLIAFCFIIVLGAFTTPVEEVFVDDEYVYGEYFCNYDGSCISTGGSMTLEKLTIMEYLKYKDWKEKVNEEVRNR